MASLGLVIWKAFRVLVLRLLEVFQDLIVCDDHQTVLLLEVDAALAGDVHAGVDGEAVLGHGELIIVVFLLKVAAGLITHWLQLDKLRCRHNGHRRFRTHDKRHRDRHRADIGYVLWQARAAVIFGLATDGLRLHLLADFLTLQV